MSIFKAFKKPSVSQVELGNALLKSVTNEDFVVYNDSQISDLLRGKKNVGIQELEVASSCDWEEYLCRFKETVIPLVNANEIVSMVAAMRLALVADVTIRMHTVVDPLSLRSKEQIVRGSAFCAGDLLAGLFLYVLLNVENRGTEADAKEIDEAFVGRARLDADGVRLVDSWGEAVCSHEVLWRNGPNSVSVAEGDIFARNLCAGEEAPRLIAIPVDTSFRMRLAQGLEEGDPFLVSERTLHGKFLKRFGTDDASVAELERRVESELLHHGFVKNPTGCYPIGSVAVVEDGSATFCLLAISEHDSFGNTQANADDIRHAIKSLIVFYDKRGMGRTLRIPLVGTGRSRANLSAQNSFDLIVRCLAENRQRIQGEVVIVALPEDFKDIDIEDARECFDV